MVYMYLAVCAHTARCARCSYPCMYINYSTAHVKGKHYTCVSRGLHTGYTQIDNTSHVCDYLGARGLHMGYTQHATHVWKSTRVWKISTRAANRSLCFIG